MKLSFPLSCLLLVGLLDVNVAGSSGTWVSVAQTKPPTAEEILDRFIQVTGGRAAYEKLHNEVIMGTIEFVEAGIKGKTAEYKAEPDKSYRVVDLADVGKVEAGTDGSVAWEHSSETGPRIKTGEEKATALREASFNAALRWHDLYDKVECLGEEKINAQLCHKVVLTPKDGKPITQYYDEKSGLLIKVEMTSLTPTMGMIPTESLLDDYRSVEGIMIAHNLRRKVLGQEIIIRIESAQFNVDMPKDRFDLPADIKKLVEVKK